MSSKNDYASYIRSIADIPLLTDEEEYNTAILAQQGDKKAQHNLVISHLKFVIPIAKKLGGYSVEILDLIQEGNIGLLRAATKFDPARNVRFSSFARYDVRSYMLEYIVHNQKIVRSITNKKHRRLFFHYKSLLNGKELTQQKAEYIAEECRVEVSDVFDYEFRVMENSSLNEPCFEDSDSSKIDFLPSKHSNIEYNLIIEQTQQHRSNMLEFSLNSLDYRSRDIIQSRWLTDDKSTLQDLSDIYEVSRERIRQIEFNSMIKMTEDMSQHVEFA